jgi:very-short-patch-repair endonuclease
VPDGQQNDLCNLLSYAEELLRVSERVIADLSKDAVRVFHEYNVTRLEGVQADSGPDEWLRIARLRETPPPAPDPMFEGWLSGLGAVSEPPKLASKLLIPADLDMASELLEAGLALAEDVMPQRGAAADPLRVDVLLRTENMPEFVEAYRAYCTGPWRSWAEAERPRRDSITFYNHLFEAHQRTVASGDDAPIECVMGVGVARWEHPEGRIDTPLIEAMVELDLDEGDGAILIRPRAQPPRVTLRAFDERGVHAAGGTQRDAAAKLDRIVADPDGGFSPFDRAGFEPVLRICQARLAGNAVYLADESDLPPAERPLPRPDTILRVSDSWVLYIRQRSVDFRCDDISRLKKQLEEVGQGTELPPPAVQLASRPSNLRVAENQIDLEEDVSAAFPEEASYRGAGAGHAGSGEPSAAAEARSLFLPLPYNDEQAEIIARLEQKGTAGVVVQGPPGTGKTHTIANIICHYMARGRRVLVTARSPEALTALQSKMPDEIRALAIAVIHSDREGARQLEEAVGILAREVASIDRDELNRERTDRERRLAQVKEEIARLDRDIRAYAEQNLLEVPFRGERLLPMALAARIEAERPAHDWFEDRLERDDRFQPRFGDAEIAEARALRARLGADLAYPAAALPEPAALPDVARLLAAHGALAREAETEARAVRGDLPYVSLAAPNAAELIRQTHAWLEALGAWLGEIDAGGHRWVLLAYQVLLEARPADPATRQALGTLMADWVRLQADGRNFALQGIEAPVPPGDAAFDTAVEKLSRGEKPFGLFGGGGIKAQLAQVRVAGQVPSPKPPADTASWKQVHDWRRWQREVQAFLGRWNAAARIAGLAPLPTEWQAGSDELLRLGSLVERMQVFHQEAPQRLTVIAGLFPHGVDAHQVVVFGKLDGVREALAANLDRSGGRQAHAIKASLEAVVATAPSLPFQTGLAAILGMLGNTATTVPDLAEAWGEVLEEAARLAALRPDRQRLEAIAALVTASGASLWASRLLSDRPEADREDRWTPPDWRQSWEWARAVGFVARISDRERIAGLSARRAELDEEQRRLLGEIVRLRTFIGLKQGITTQVAAALAKFVAAVRRIGGGSGKSAERHRRASREAALEAAAAVPCWILPEWRVAEQLPSELGCFDLVVVDEASQSDITALPVVLRGRQLLVVGDDKQVSPSAVGIEERFAIQLRETYLRGMPIANFLDPATSLYDLASMTFPGSVTMLREHFRCVEPIIRYSSRFYPKALVPLRLPTVSERLDPPLVDVYIPHGRKLHDVNRTEAEWIVEEIERIVADPGMARRTIGMISLIGDKQAKLVQDELTKRLGTDILLRHKIMCGNAATFQGQERDIMFLSMVSCSETVRTQTTRSTEQRFNVALSRARDRLYLVRSVKASELKHNDLKLGIIEHFANPMEGATIAQPADVLEACDSDFERDVGRRLLAMGYRVKPQVPVAGFRIDFVVEGTGDKRLAIELDGDRFHGPDRWADDLRRQRALERMGWTFWRCWGSQWLADPDSCFQDLLAILQHMGIAPVSGEFLPVAWTRHITVSEVSEEPAAASETQDAAAGIIETPILLQAALPFPDAQLRQEGDAAADETVVAAGDTVVVRFADTQQLRRFRISKEQHAPDKGFISVAQPLAQALLGSSVDEEVEFEVDGKTRIAVVERILKAA